MTNLTFHEEPPSPKDELVLEQTVNIVPPSIQISPRFRPHKNARKILVHDPKWLFVSSIVWPQHNQNIHRYGGAALKRVMHPVIKKNGPERQSQEVARERRRKYTTKSVDGMWERGAFRRR